MSRTEAVDSKERGAPVSSVQGPSGRPLNVHPLVAVAVPNYNDVSYQATSDLDYATMAYDASNGGQLWATRYNCVGNGFDSANSIVGSPMARRCS
jgi:hypothetical protein